MTYDEWPDCAVQGCPNKCCLRLQSKYCYPHSIGLPQDVNKEKEQTKEKELTT